MGCQAQGGALQEVWLYGPSLAQVCDGKADVLFTLFVNGEGGGGRSHCAEGSASFSAGPWRKLLAFGDVSSARNGVGDCPVHCRAFSIPNPLLLITVPNHRTRNRSHGLPEPPGEGLSPLPGVTPTGSFLTREFRMQFCYLVPTCLRGISSQANCVVL